MNSMQGARLAQAMVGPQQRAITGHGRASGSIHCKRYETALRSSYAELTLTSPFKCWILLFGGAVTLVAVRLFLSAPNTVKCISNTIIASTRVSQYCPNFPDIYVWQGNHLRVRVWRRSKSPQRWVSPHIVLLYSSVMQTLRFRCLPWQSFMILHTPVNRSHKAKPSRHSSALKMCRPQRGSRALRMPSA